MSFRLFYRGPLRSNGSKEDKHRIRLMIHPQLEKLWGQERMKGFRDLGYLTKEEPASGHYRMVGILGSLLDKEPIDHCILYPVGNIDYASLVTERLKVHAELDILFLRPGSPGQIITSGGDIDNRLKTLFDGLRKPHDEQELPDGELLDRTPNPCHCLLSDDSLISKISVTTDTLLRREER